MRRRKGVGGEDEDKLTFWQAVIIRKLDKPSGINHYHILAVTLPKTGSPSVLIKRNSSSFWGITYLQEAKFLERIPLYFRTLRQNWLK